MKFESLIAEFGARYGMEDLGPDENGAVGFEADGCPVTLQQLPETETVLAAVEVCGAPEAGEAAVNRLVMTANQALYALDGMALVRSSESGGYRLLNRFDVAAMDFIGFDRQMGRFLDLAEKWRELIEKFVPIAAEAEAKGVDAAATMPDLPFADNAMRV